MRRYIALVWLFLCSLRHLLHPRQTMRDKKPSPALLPVPVARAVSLTTRATRLAIRVGSFLSTLSLDVVKLGTLSSLVLVRGIIERALNRTAQKKKNKDKATTQQKSRTKSASANVAANSESRLSRSLENLHGAVGQFTNWTSVGFRLAGTTLSTASQGSQLILTSLDQLFGSTDSSRAIASIITVIRREFLLGRPNGGQRGGERVAVADLVQAVGTLAYLQHACQTTAEEESRRRSLEEIVCDVVIFREGDRIDVEELPLSNSHHQGQSMKSPVPTLPNTCSAEDDGALMNHLRGHIWNHLPPGTVVSVSNSVSCLQTITLDINGPQLLSLPTPPGLEFVGSRVLAPRAEYRSRMPCTLDDDDARMYQVTYKIHRKRLATLSLNESNEDSEPIVKTPGHGSFRKDDEPEVAQGIDDEDDDDGSSSYSPVSCSFSPMTPQSNTTNSSFSPMSPSPGLKSPTGLTSAVARFNSSHAAASPTPTSTLGSNKFSRKPTSFYDFTRPTMSSSRRHTEAANQRRSRTTPLHIPKPSQDVLGISKQSHTKGHRIEMNVAGRTLDWERKMGARHVLRGGQSATRLNGRESGVEECAQPQSPGVMQAESSSNEPDARQRDYLPSPISDAFGESVNDPQSPLVSPSCFGYSPSMASNGFFIPQIEGSVDDVFSISSLLSDMIRYMQLCADCSRPKYSRSARNFNKESNRDMHHHTHATESEAAIPLASFVDSPSGIDLSGSSGGNMSLAHHLWLDHQAKAVILTCVSSTGWEEVLAQLACDYDSLAWQGRAFNVHKGAYASARRLLYGEDARMLETIREALQEFPDYALVLCGHSWGAGVASVLGVMLSEPNPRGPGFVISTEPYMEKYTSHGLPTGRRIQVYAYGPPAVMSPSLSGLTRGLITTLVHGNDIVPHLSLGLLHDFQNLALTFKNDKEGIKSALRQRIWSVLQDDMTSRWYGRSSSEATEGDEWMLPALASMRAAMESEKLVPPGDVFTIQCQPLPQREVLEQRSGQPTQRIIFRRVKDVDGLFGELRFGTSLLTDHSAAKYEAAIKSLMLGLGSK